jgi:hypothetical protein
MSYFFKISFAVVLINLFTNVSYAKTESLHFELNSKYGIVNFQVHFNDFDKLLAERVVDIAQNDLIKVVDYFEYAPSDTIHINIDSKMRLSNGNARIFPTNIINLYNFPASNKEHLIVMEDWWQGLILHEFTHIIHLDQTRDYLAVGKNIFGSIAKVPTGIVPRWFTEGIATWSESTFLKRGRRDHELLNKELWLYLNDSNACQSIDCIDEPGRYPNGQLSYWVGAKFIDFVERVKPKSVKCLVETNSSKLPFLLNRTFEECTDISVYDAFDKFLQEFLKKYSAKNIKDENLIEQSVGPVNFQKGWLLNGNKFFRVEKTKLSEELVATDVDAHVTISGKYSHPIADIAGIVALDKDSNALLVSFNEDPNYKVENKSWKLVDDETLTIESSLDFGFDPSYVIPFSKTLFGTFTYKENHWVYKLVEQTSNSTKIVSEVNLPGEFNINFVRQFQDKILLKATLNGTGLSSLIIADTDLKAVKVLYSSKDYFDILGFSTKSFVIKEKEDFFKLSYENEIYSIQNLNPNNFKELSFFELNETNGVVLDNQLVSKKLNLMDVQGEKRNLSLSEWEFDPTKEKSLTTFPYPSLEHYKPHYWFLAFGNSDNLGSIGALTTFSDPMEINTISTSAFYYPDVSKLGGVVSFLHDRSPYLFELNFTQEYSKNSISSTNINDKKYFDINFKYKIEKKRFLIMPSFFFGVDSVSDFISDRNTKYFGVRGYVGYQANSYNDLVSRVNYTGRVAIDTPSNGESYTNFQNKIDSLFRFSQNLTTEFRLSEGKLFKSDLKRGVLYGGGTNSLQLYRWFEFYGLPYGNAYGNELMSTRLKIDFNVLDYYRGYELLPVYLKEVHLLFGFESLAADVIYFSDKYLFDSSLKSIFGGVKLKSTFFYLAPVDIDLIISHVTTKENVSKKVGTIAISAELF